MLAHQISYDGSRSRYISSSEGNIELELTRYSDCREVYLSCPMLELETRETEGSNCDFPNLLACQGGECVKGAFSDYHDMHTVY